MRVKKAVIPAAGFGLRMLPASKTVPKLMLPLVDKPAIQYIIEEAVASGIEDICIVTGRDKTVMEDYFDYTPELEDKLAATGKLAELEAVRRIADMANIYYVRQKEALGLGHAVWKAHAFVGDEPFAVLLPDDIMFSEVPATQQLIAAAEQHGTSAIATQLVPAEDIAKKSSLKVEPLDGRVMRLLDMNEKPTPQEKFSDYAILGRYVLTSEIFGILAKTAPGHGGEIQITDALRKLCNRDPMVAVDFDGRYYDTGNMRGFLEATIDYALRHNDLGDWLRDFIKAKSQTL